MNKKMLKSRFYSFAIYKQIVYIEFIKKFNLIQNCNREKHQALVKGNPIINNKFLINHLKMDLSSKEDQHYNQNNNNLNTIENTEENPATFLKLKNLLDEKQLNYKLMEVLKIDFLKFFIFTILQHPPTKTSEESAKVRGTTLESGAKALLVKGDKGFALIIISAAKKFNNKAAKKLLSTKNLRFADLSEVKNLTVNKLIIFIYS